MAKYLLTANYTKKGAKGLMKEGGTGRKAAVAKVAESLGGSLEAMYFALGDADVYVIVDMPDHASAVAASLVVNAAGGATSCTTVLLTAEEMDAAAKMTPDYRRPGG